MKPFDIAAAFIEQHEAQSLGWLKQYENAFLAYPPDVARRFPRRLQEPLGYRIHRPNLGGYEGQDPAVLFDTRARAGCGRFDFRGDRRRV